MADEVLEQNQGEVAEPQEAPSPQTLAEAFGMLREADKDSSAGPVAGQPEDIAATPGAAVESMGGSEPEPTASEEPSQPELGGGEELAGFDPNPARQDLLRRANAEAVRQTQEMFNKQGVRLMDIADLYERDERDGRVTFKNPDDPNRPFQSRYEAQQFVDSINKQINSRYQKELRNQQQQILQSMGPQFALIEFAPAYEAMSQAEKDVFDDLISPYAITDSGGNVIGFNVNLQAAGQTAKAIVQRFNMRKAAPAAAPATQPQQPQQKKQQPASTPALDMPSSTGTSDDEEPKTLEEAFAKLGKMKKGK